ncbi:MAG: rhodanese-like domain-containing protein [Gemmatimonadetes bacterium]|nr:rhodanese-like domain-containing protein [Gemmatimonadota bacterium]
MTAPGTGTTGEIPEISPSELKQRLDRHQPVVLVDVREPFEKDIADLPDYGQLRIPVGDFLERMDELDPSDAIVLYCRSGARSGWAVQQLQEKGFASVFNLKGGVLGWREEVDPSLSAY